MIIQNSDAVLAKLDHVSQDFKHMNGNYEISEGFVKHPDIHAYASMDLPQPSFDSKQFTKFCHDPLFPCHTR